MIIDAQRILILIGMDILFDKFIENMDENNIDITWLLSWETPEDEYDPHYLYVTPG